MSNVSDIYQIFPIAHIRPDFQAFFISTMTWIPEHSLRMCQTFKFSQRCFLPEVHSCKNPLKSVTRV